MINEQVKAIIFDLDGTLLDTIEDLTFSLNATLKRNGFPIHPCSSVKQFVGNGAYQLVRRALPAGTSEDTIRAILEEYTAAYSTHRTVFTHPYEEVVDTLIQLKSRQIPMAVLSNKPHEDTVHLIEKYFPSDIFMIVRGNQPGVPHKPDPTAPLQCAAELNIPPTQFAFVGDSAVDMQTAHNAGMLPIGCSWGFRGAAELLEHGCVYLIDTMPQLLNILTDL